MFKPSLNLAGVLSWVNKHTLHSAAIIEGTDHGQARKMILFVDMQALPQYPYFFMMTDFILGQKTRWSVFLNNETDKTLRSWDHGIEKKSLDAGQKLVTRCHSLYRNQSCGTT